jgi:hypothetical protein
LAQSAENFEQSLPLDSQLQTLEYSVFTRKFTFWFFNAPCLILKNVKTAIANTLWNIILKPKIVK